MQNNQLKKIHAIQIDILKIIDNICRENSIAYWIDFGTLLGAIREKGFIPWDDDLDISMPREDYIRFINLPKNKFPNSIFVQSYKSDPKYTNSIETKIRDNGSTFIEYKDVDYHQGIFIDIFPYDKTFRNNRLRKFHHSLYKSFINGYICNITKNRSIFKNERFLRQKILTIIYKIIPFKFVESFIINLAALNKKFIWRPTLASKIDDNIIEQENLFPLSTVEFEGIKTFAPNNPEKHLKELYGDWKKRPEKSNRKPTHHCFVDTSLSWSLKNKTLWQ